VLYVDKEEKGVWDFHTQNIIDALTTSYFMVGCVVFLWVVTNVFIMFNVVFNAGVVVMP
jgi:hypothetical protein